MICFQSFYLQTLYEELPTVCRCHGTTGSCAYKTCWKTLPRFEKVGDTLREMYKEAIKVTHHNGTLYEIRPRSKRIKKSNIISLKSSALVYMEESPDYCRGDPGSGYPGTLNRYCDSSDPNTCKNLCEACGYKTVKKQVLIRDKKCFCRFEWCCKVTCLPCNKYVVKMKCARKEIR